MARRRTPHDELESAHADRHSPQRSQPPLLPLSSEEALSSRQYVASTFALCLCTLTHAYLLISVFPYGGFMAIELPHRSKHVMVNEENAGSYAGLLASSFMIGRAVSSYPWGKWADRYGRTSVLQASLALSCLFSILFGASQTFAQAVIFRSLLGLCNGIIGTTKTLVSEVAAGNQVLETRGMAWVIGMRGWGFLISPAIGGSLAEAAKQYPNAPLVLRFYGFFSKFPFLLPNIVGASFCIASAIAVCLFVRETLPPSQAAPSDSAPVGRPQLFVRDVVEWVTILKGRVLHAKKGDRVSLNDFSNGSSYSSVVVNEGEDVRYKTRIEPERTTVQSSSHTSLDNDDEEPTMTLIWSRSNTRRHLIIYWAYSFVIISVDEAFPLFCISWQAGLGLSEAAIGKILSISGLLFVVCQFLVYTWLVGRFGIYRSINVATLATIPAIALIPISLWLQSSSGVLNGSLLVYMSIVMAMYRIFANIFFSSITIATNRTVSASYRASMNGLSMLGASMCKGLGPALSGLFVAFSFSSGIMSTLPPDAPAVLVFGVLSILALLVAVPAATRLEPVSSGPQNERAMNDTNGR